jgi:hypothetical protein
MGIGLFTRWASIAVTALHLFAMGYAYSFGKIDHSIILVIAPLILSFANWGGSISVDALLRKRDAASVRQWPVRLLAISIGISFATAAYAKISTGWLSPNAQTVKGYFLRTYYTSSSHNGIAELAQSIQAPWLWEVLDWTVVGVEFTLAIAFLSWRLLRIAISLAMFFHLGVYFLLNIDFYGNVIAYGAFVSWGRLIPARLSRERQRVIAPIALVLAGLVGVWAALEVTDVLVRGIPGLGPLILWVGTIGGAAYLLWWFVRLVRRVHPLVAFSANSGIAPHRPGALVLRCVVAILVISLPVTLVIKQDIGEPYPALFQPDFYGPGPLVGARVISTRPVITLVFAGGKRLRVDASEVLPSPTDVGAEFDAAFSIQRRDNDIQTRRWLGVRLAKKYSPLVPVEMTVTWVRTKYDHISGQIKYRTPLKTVTVKFPTEG